MRLISNDDGTWEMQRVREMEFIMLSRLQEAADMSESPEARERMFPSPLGRPSVDDAEDELVQDWESLVQPDLETLFNSAMTLVLKDLQGMKGRKFKGEMEYKLTVPKKHADAWCSALNQARLVLHERFNLPDQDEVLDAENGHEQWLAILQSEVYGHIMEFLVRDILWLK